MKNNNTISTDNRLFSKQQKAGKLTKQILHFLVMKIA